MQTVAEGVLKFIKKLKHHKERNVNRQGVDVFLKNGSLCLGTDVDDSYLICFNISKITEDYFEMNKDVNIVNGTVVDTRKYINTTYKVNEDEGVNSEGTYNNNNDEVQDDYIDDNCGLFGCGSSSWRSAPEKVWQGQYLCFVLKIK